ncbi:MAG: hypothetical protein AB9834_16695 [Lentimicrobium sp.]
MFRYQPVISFSTKGRLKKPRTLRMVDFMSNGRYIQDSVKQLIV